MDNYSKHSGARQAVGRGRGSPRAVEIAGIIRTIRRRGRSRTARAARARGLDLRSEAMHGRRPRSMAELFQRLVGHTFQVRGDLWDWFNRLTREEWVVVLAVVSVLGFLCMLGYGSRSKY
jgi:hypothetical protein